MKAHMNKMKRGEGINDEDLSQSAIDYDKHKSKMIAEGKNVPLGEGILVWDGTKVNDACTKTKNTSRCLSVLQ